MNTFSFSTSHTHILSVSELEFVPFISLKFLDRKTWQVWLPQCCPEVRKLSPLKYPKSWNKVMMLWDHKVNIKNCYLSFSVGLEAYLTSLSFNSFIARATSVKTDSQLYKQLGMCKEPVVSWQMSFYSFHRTGFILVVDLSLEETRISDKMSNGQVTLAAMFSSRATM